MHRKLMKPIDKVKQSARILKLFPNTHLIALGAVTLGLAAIFFMPSVNQQKQEAQSVQVIAIPSIESTEEELPPTTNAHESNTTPEPATEFEQFTQDKPITLKVKSGDTLSALFKRAGLNDSTMINFLRSNEETKQLKKLMPNQVFDFYINDNNQLSGLTVKKNKLEQLEYRYTDDKLSFKHVTKTPDIRIAFRSATIEHSLYLAGSKIQLDDALIMGLAGVFGWDIDFALDIRKGDHFKILFEEKFLDGEKLGNGDILAAEFINQGNKYRAVRYIDANNQASYYAPTGESMQKAFLRAPLDFRRISSNFNPARLHPISKTVKPHRGTDYAASTGTPVWAAGNGRVIASSYTNANGNYVIIQHGNNIQTKYLHLQKRYVSKGDRVRQKQKIGTVGSTGFSTAPHLHYEFLLDGVHRNPRTILGKLPKAESIAASEFHRFINQTQPLIAALESEANKYAAIEPPQTTTAL